MKTDVQDSDIPGSDASDIDIPDDEYREIEALIASDESPVGIDAKKTHVLILHKLIAIERRLGRLEADR